MIRVFALVYLFLVTPVMASAQSGTHFPELKTLGVGAVQAEPDLATIPITVRVLDDSPDVVGERASTIITAIVDTLKALGVHDSAIPSRSFTVSTNRQGTRTGEPDYRADASLQLTTSALDSLGIFIGAAISAGATDISNVRFDTSERPRLREEALKLAVASARREAEIVSEANGGTLGKLMHMTTIQETFVRNVYVEYERPLIQRDVISQSSLTIEARVEARWYMIIPE